MELRAIKGNLREKTCSYCVRFAFHGKFMGSVNTFPRLRAPVKRKAGYVTSWLARTDWTSLKYYKHYNWYFILIQNILTFTCSDMFIRLSLFINYEK